MKPWQFESSHLDLCSRFYAGRKFYTDFNSGKDEIADSLSDGAQRSASDVAAWTGQRVRVERSAPNLRCSSTIQRPRFKWSPTTIKWRRRS